MIKQLSNSPLHFGLVCNWLFLVTISIFILFINQFVAPNNFIISVSSILLYGYLICLLWQSSQAYVVISFLFIFTQFTAIISSTYLESGAYISEQGIMSYSTGGTFRLYVLCCIYFICGLLGFKWVENLTYKITPKRMLLVTESKSIVQYIIILLGVLNLLCFIIGLLRFGSPLLMGIQRFQYWSNLDKPLAKYMIMTLYLSLPIGAMQVTANKLIKHFCRFWLYGSLCTVILYGEKFSGLFLIVVMYCVGVYISHSKDRPSLNIFNIRNITIVIIAIASIFLLIYYHYSSIHSVGSNIIDYILSRIFALQGHTWWGIDAQMNKGMVSKGLSKLTSLNSDNIPGGIYLLMYEISPTKLVNLYREFGITFTMGSPAIAVYSIGYFGACIYQIMGGVLVGSFLSLCTFSLQHGRFLDAILFSKLIFVFLQVFSMGNSYFLILPSSIGIMFLLAILSLRPIRFKYTWLNNRSIFQQSIASKQSTSN